MVVKKHECTVVSERILLTFEACPRVPHVWKTLGISSHHQLDPYYQLMIYNLCDSCIEESFKIKSNLLHNFLNKS